MTAPRVLLASHTYAAPINRAKLDALARRVALSAVIPNRWRDAELWLVGQVDAGFTSILAGWRELAGVRYLGHVHDPVALFQQADVFAFPTIEEGSALGAR